MRKLRQIVSNPIRLDILHLYRWSFLVFHFIHNGERNSRCICSASNSIDYDLKVELVYGGYDVRNERSLKLMEKLGFDRINKEDNESYKNDVDGNPTLISVYD